MEDALGLYLSIPFCRAKCTFCNFASDAFAPGRLPIYLDQLGLEIAQAHDRAASLGTHLPPLVDTLYLGGGTPSLLSHSQVDQVFTTLRQHFRLAPDAEITVEAAPGQISPATLEAFQSHGVNRLSFGIQSFVDRESAAIGRLHTAAQCHAEIDRVRAAGILNLSLDLIAGLPHQTEASWQYSLAEAIASGVPHISIYMLEIDEESRLGREILASGARYGAAAVPSDDDSAAFYELACESLGRAGIQQYEISNFARPGFASTHNLKYWRRQPYLGLGLDAHSMLRSPAGDLRFANTDDLDAYCSRHAAPTAGPGSWGREENPLSALRALSTNVAPPAPVPVPLTPEERLEETLFLGLRLNAGIDLHALRSTSSASALGQLQPALTQAVADGLLSLDNSIVRLTSRGRMLSNEVFSRLLLDPNSAAEDRVTLLGAS